MKLSRLLSQGTNWFINNLELHNVFVLGEVHPGLVFALSLLDFIGSGFLTLP